MTKKEFAELTGQNPEDVLGGDWENIIDDCGNYEKEGTNHGK